ncbi:DUF3040 domain-containing protein [Streptomyces sp. NPDC002888]|uniref:DUF3040 domain-containing protein n=1 Tax=Streptomyces sp. NPDC002888 TaxID=3364668 RepID=UPI003696116D
MDEGDTDDVRLSPGEHLALLRIEAALGRDRRFARAMRGRPAGPWSAVRRFARAKRRRPTGPWLAVSVLALACASVLLAVLGIRTADPAVVWCFAALWPLTLLQTFRLLRRLTHRDDRDPRRM